MPEALVIPLAGQPYSGKDEICNHWAEKYGVQVVSFGQIIRKWANERGYPVRSRADSAVAYARITQEDPQLFMRELADRAAAAEIVCVNGLRVVSHLHKIKTDFNSTSVGLICPPWARYLRALEAPARAEKPVGSYPEFLAQEQPEYYSDSVDGIATQTVIDLADHHLPTDTPKSTMWRMSDDFLESQLDKRIF